MPSDDELNCIREAAAFINNYQNPKGEKDLMMSWLTDLEDTVKRITKELSESEVAIIYDFIEMLTQTESPIPELTLQELNVNNLQIISHHTTDYIDLRDVLRTYYYNVRTTWQDINRSHDKNI